MFLGLRRSLDGVYERGTQEGMRRVPLLNRAAVLLSAPSQPRRRVGLVLLRSLRIVGHRFQSYLVVPLGTIPKHFQVDHASRRHRAHGKAKRLAVDFFAVE